MTRSGTKRWLHPVTGAALLAVLSWHPAPAAAPVDIREWQVPWDYTRPRDPFVDPAGRTWFCGQGGGYLAYLDPATGDFRRYDLGEGAGPHNLIVDADGQVWYAGNRRAHIGRLDPDSGNIEKFPMPLEAARDPHTLVFDDAGNIWFTVQHGNFIGRLNMATGRVSLVAVPTENARPYGIKTGVDGRRPWIVLFGTNKLATVDPASMALEELDLPRAEARPRRLEVNPDGTVWYVDYAGGMLGRFNPADGSFKEWPMPGGGDSRPYGMAGDDRDNLWFVETGSVPNRLVGFNPGSEEFFSITEIGSGGGTVRHMYFHPPTREIWFGTDTNYVGRAAVP